jgi:hypothetical protein
VTIPWHDRREFLRLGGGLALAGCLSPLAQGRSAPFRGARSCILVYLTGGPPHLDTWDLKSAAPTEVRGSFRPIATHDEDHREDATEVLPATARLPVSLRQRRPGNTSLPVAMSQKHRRSLRKLMIVAIVFQSGEMAHLVSDSMPSPWRVKRSVPLPSQTFN